VTVSSGNIYALQLADDEKLRASHYFCVSVTVTAEIQQRNIVDYVIATLERLAAQKGHYDDPEDRAAIFTALFSMALKSGSLQHILRVIHLLLLSGKCCV